VKGSGKRRICVICESIFDIPQLKHGRDRKSKRITCGQSCHLKLIKRRAKPWTKGEMDIIEEISASMPPKRLYQTYCRMAADQELSQAHRSSVQVQVGAHGHTADA
jgi:hypothetical protein